MPSTIPLQKQDSTQKKVIHYVFIELHVSLVLDSVKGIIL